jgi:hypothetical protein
MRVRLLQVDYLSRIFKGNEERTIFVGDLYNLREPVQRCGDHFDSDEALRTNTVPWRTDLETTEA